MRDLLRRIGRLEDDLLPEHGDDPKLIRIRGGVSLSLTATIGGRDIYPLLGESEDDFIDRLFVIAYREHAAFIVVAGPDTDGSY